jgi:integrase/recombinase XerD
MSVNYVWKSRISMYITAYLKITSVSGYKYMVQKRRLRQFDQYCFDHNAPEEALPKDIVEGYCFGDEYDSIYMQQYRIRLLRNLAAYMVIAGCSVYLIPSPEKPLHYQRHAPYIYTEKELKELFIQIDTWKQVRTSHSNRKKVDPLLFRMLYGCGLRIMEALNLKTNDVNLEEGILRIRMAKNNKERFVPMASSLVERCKIYLSEIHIEDTQDSYFFPGRHDGCYDQSTIYRRFRQYLWKAGISHSGSGPRVHDIRHAYCVHRLKRWTLEGKELTNLIPYLSAYLGHSDFRGTEYYLRLTTDLYPEIISKMELSFSYIIPEKGGSHE